MSSKSDNWIGLLVFGLIFLIILATGGPEAGAGIALLVAVIFIIFKVYNALK